MKKLLALVLASAMVFSVVGCASSDTASASTTETTTETTESTGTTVTTATVDVDTTIADGLISADFIDPVSEWGSV